MPFSFIEIEQKKSRVIIFVFFFLILFYFITAWLLLLISKNVFSSYLAGEKYFRFAFPTVNQTIIVFFVAFFIGLFHWTFSTNNLIDKMTNSVGAIQIDPKDIYHQYLKNIVDEVSVAIGGRPIYSYVIPSAALNAFSLVDLKGNAVIGVTEGLMARLNRYQIEAVVGHEAGHIVSGDCLNTTIVCSLSELYRELLSGLGEGRGLRLELKGRGGLFIVLVYLVLSLMSFLNRLLNTFISRQREYRADAIAVRLTRNPLALAEALKLISEKWRGFGSKGEYLESIFIVSPRHSSLDEESGALADLFSTHPPIDKRIDILLDMAHLDEKALEEKLKNMIRVSPVAKSEFKETITSGQKRWLVFREGNWQGPFDESGLKALKGLIPTDWIRLEGQDVVQQAFEDKEVASFLGIRKQPAGEDKLCPRCHADLSEIIYEGTPILKCSYCEGVFVDHNKISRILIREDKKFSQQIIDFAESAYKTKLRDGKFMKPGSKSDWKLDCPKCHRKMHRQFFVYSYPIEIDRCQNCDGDWFDKEELEVLQYLYQNKEKNIS